MRADVDAVVAQVGIGMVGDPTGFCCYSPRFPAGQETAHLQNRISELEIQVTDAKKGRERVSGAG